MRTVYLIILNCNNMSVIPELCHSLKEALKDNEYPVDIRFIDQGSTDGSYEFLEEFCSLFSNCVSCTVRRLKKNVGTTKGWNIALKDICNSHTNYTCVINSDMKVSKNFLKPMIEIMESNPKCGMVSNTLRDYTNINFVQNYGPDINNPWHYRMGIMPVELFDKVKPFQAEWGHMGCTLFRSEVFEDIGLFDENFFIYSCDFDFQFRMKLAGYEIWFCPQSYAQHKTFVTCNELKKNPVIEELCRKDGEYLHWKWGDKVFEWFNHTSDHDINKNLKTVYGEDFKINEIYS